MVNGGGDGRTDGRTEGRTDGRTDGRTPPASQGRLKTYNNGYNLIKPLKQILSLVNLTYHFFKDLE